MKLAVSLFGLFFYTQVVDSQLVGYVGKSITFPSGADPSWILKKIEWAIYSNNTWIATHRGVTTKTDRFHRYGSRLRLNTLTGDLTIHELSLNDAMEYSVDLTNDRGENRVRKIKLEVKYPLEKPNITQYQWFTGQSCVIVLRCQSSVQDAELFWNTTSLSGETGTVKRPDGLFLFIYTAQMSNEFICTSRREKDDASSVFQAICDGKSAATTVTPKNSPAPPIKPPCPRERLGLYFFGGFILGVFFMALLFKFFKVTGQLQSPGKCLKGTRCSS